jgi:hypothetical protein
MQRISAEQKKGEDDSDMHLARNIMQNKQFKVSTQADDEYDFEDGPSRKSRKKQGGDDPKNNQKKMNANRFLTQKERCLFCLENPNRPMHLVVSIANFTYLMLPQWQPVVPGHCCILPIQVSLISTIISVYLRVEDKLKKSRACCLLNTIPAIGD